MKKDRRETNVGTVEAFAISSRGTARGGRMIVLAGLMPLPPAQSQKHKNLGSRMHVIHIYVLYVHLSYTNKQIIHISPPLPDPGLASILILSLPLLPSSHRDPLAGLEN